MKVDTAARRPVHVVWETADGASRFTLDYGPLSPAQLGVLCEGLLALALALTLQTGDDGTSVQVVAREVP